VAKSNAVTKGYAVAWDGDINGHVGSLQALSQNDLNCSVPMITVTSCGCRIPNSCTQKHCSSRQCNSLRQTECSEMYVFAMLLRVYLSSDYCGALVVCF